MEGGDNHIYNRTQFSMLQSFNHHWPSSGLRYEINSLINGYKYIYTPFEKIISISFSLKKKKNHNHLFPSSRYGADSSWRSRHHHQIYSPYSTCTTGRATLVVNHHNTRVTGLYGSVAERIFGSNNTSTSATPAYNNQAHTNHIPSTWRSRYQITSANGEFQSINRQSWEDHSCLDNSSATRNTLKRKALDYSDGTCDLDLNLSLKVPPKEEKALGFGLSLSLSPSSSSSKLGLVKKLQGSGRHDREHGRKASTLDLTL